MNKERFLSTMLILLIIFGIYWGVSAFRQHWLEQEMLLLDSVHAAEQAFSQLSPQCYAEKKDVKIIARKDNSSEYLIDVTVHLGPEAFTAVLYLHTIDGRRLEYSSDIFSLIYTTPEERQECIDYLKELYQW